MKPVASLSLDADNQWSYEMIRGERDWASAPSYLGRMAPRVLELFGERDLYVTFFLIGRDNTLPLEIWSRLRRGITPEINAISTLIFAVSVALIIIWYRLRTRATLQSAAS